jgi:hypothetical protein
LYADIVFGTAVLSKKSAQLNPGEMLLTAVPVFAGVYVTVFFLET